MEAPGIKVMDFEQSDFPEGTDEIVITSNKDGDTVEEIHNADGSTTKK